MAEGFDAAAIVAEARSWIGTRWMHGVALKGYGADCAQFVLAFGKSLGWIAESYQPPVYNRDWALHNERSVMVEELARFSRQVPAEQMRPGDILAFVSGRCAGHVGIFLGAGRMVHAHVRNGVCEVDLAPWLERLHSVWRAA